MKSALALIVVGVWIGAQILKGGALDRLAGGSSGRAPSSPGPSGSAPASSGAPAGQSTGAATNQPGYAPSAARLGQYG